MKYQKIINLLGNLPNQPSKFGTKNWVEINNDSRETYSTDIQIKFKTTMLNSILYDYSDAYIIVKGTRSIAPVPPPAVNPNNTDKEVVSKIVLHLLIA